MPCILEAESRVNETTWLFYRAAGLFPLVCLLSPSPPNHYEHCFSQTGPQSVFSGVFPTEKNNNKTTKPRMLQQMKTETKLGCTTRRGVKSAALSLRAVWSLRALMPLGVNLALYLGAPYAVELLRSIGVLEQLIVLGPY